jgi:hypothetical protein
MKPSGKFIPFALLIVISNAIVMADDLKNPCKSELECTQTSNVEAEATAIQEPDKAIPGQTVRLKWSATITDYGQYNVTDKVNCPTKPPELGNHAYDVVLETPGDNWTTVREVFRGMVAYSPERWRFRMFTKCEPDGWRIPIRNSQPIVFASSGGGPDDPPPPGGGGGGSNCISVVEADPSWEENESPFFIAPEANPSYGNIDWSTRPTGLYVIYDQVASDAYQPGVLPFNWNIIDPAEPTIPRMNFATYLHKTYRSDIDGCFDDGDYDGYFYDTVYSLEGPRTQEMPENTIVSVYSEWGYPSGYKLPPNYWYWEFDDSWLSPYEQKYIYKLGNTHTMTIKETIDQASIYEFLDFVTDFPSWVTTEYASLPAAKEVTINGTPEQQPIMMPVNSLTGFTLSHLVSNNWNNGFYWSWPRLWYSRTRLKFVWHPDTPQEERYAGSVILLFTPEDDPETEDVNESLAVQIVSDSQGQSLVKWTITDSTDPIDIDIGNLQSGKLGKLSIMDAHLLADANHDGKLDAQDKALITQNNPFHFWVNDDDDSPGATPQADYVNNVVDGVDDLADFFPVFLDIQQLLTVLPPDASTKYKLKQADGALNLVYTNLTRATAFLYQGGTLMTGFGPSFIQPAAMATTQQITAAGIELSAAFLISIKDQSKGVLLLEGRQTTGEPLVLVVEKDGVQVAKVQVELCMLRVGKLWETSNKTNQIPNKTRKDDATAPERMEVEGDESYAVPRNNLYVVATAADNKVKVSLDMDIPAKFRPKFYAATWDGETKVAGSDAAFPSTAGQPALLQVLAATTAETKEYQIRVGYDTNSTNMLEDGEACPVPIYKRRDTHKPRYAVVKGISNSKYEEHKDTITGKIHFLGQSQPWLVAKYARSFLALFYYRGDLTRINAGVHPSEAPSNMSINAFADGEGYTEWLTHNAGAAFDDDGVASIKEYRWNSNSEVAAFIAGRTPFALESIVSNTQGYFEYPTTTGTALQAFYQAHVKAAAEQALASSPVGTALTFPLEGGWYEFPCIESPLLFKSISLGNWVPPSTQIIGADDGYSGYGALFADLMAGTEQFKDFDAFGTIGRGRVIDPRYRITVKKEDTGAFTSNIEYKVSAVEFSCDLEDLYDFNYEDGMLPSHAAAMQIGWGKGANGTDRDQGEIFRHKIRILHIYAYPFDQTMIPNLGP